MNRICKRGSTYSLALSPWYKIIILEKSVTVQFYPIYKRGKSPRFTIPRFTSPVQSRNTVCPNFSVRLCLRTRGKLMLANFRLKGLVHDNAHAHRLSLQNKFVGSTLNSKLPLPVQSLKILRFIPTSIALAGLVILR